MKTNRPSRQTILYGMFYASLLSFVAAPAAFAGDRIASGKWEFAMTTDGETNTVNACIGPAEATAMSGDSKTGRDYAEKKAAQARAPCAIKSYEIKGDTVSYSLTCGSRTITDKTAFHGESAEGVKTVTYEGKTVTTHVKSRRVGACP